MITLDIFENYQVQKYNRGKSNKGFNTLQAKFILSTSLISLNNKKLIGPTKYKKEKVMFYVG